MRPVERTKWRELLEFATFLFAIFCIFGYVLSGCSATPTAKEVGRAGLVSVASATRLVHGFCVARMTDAIDLDVQHLLTAQQKSRALALGEACGVGVNGAKDILLAAASVTDSTGVCETARAAEELAVAVNALVHYDGTPTPWEVQTALDTAKVIGQDCK